MEVRVQRKGADWIQDFLILSDVHFDSPYCDRKLLKALLEEARERNAKTIIMGDWFDAMQGRSDPRASKDELAQEYKVSSYLNRLVETSAAFLEDYKDSVIVITEGNHDSAIRRKLEADLLMWLGEKINTHVMGYAGFMIFRFSDKGSGSNRRGKTMFFHHGSGGGGIVTKGAMRAQREAAWVHADIFVGGHIHEGWRMQAKRLELTKSLKAVTVDMLHVCIPALKDEFDLTGGYHVEKGRPPKPIGGMWIRFYHNPRKHDKIGFDALKAD